MNYKKEETKNLIIKSKYDSLYRIVLTLSRQCNYKCRFCPQSNNSISENFKRGFLTLKTTDTIIKNLDDKFTGIFSLSGFGEPTLNPDFFSIISKLKNETKAKIDLISNGSDLNKLFECEADTIHISCYSPSIEENLINQTIHDSRITIIPKYNQENFNNRAGNVFISDTQIDQCCNVLLMKLSIDYNGDILKCCSDWTKRDILGNVYTNNIWDIWFNKTMYDKINMIENKRSRIEICKNCNAEGSLYGEQYKEFWKKYYEEKNKSTDNNKLFL